jgi:hypothetical protein
MYDYVRIELTSDMSEIREKLGPFRLAKATRVSGVRRRQSVSLTREAERCLFENLTVLSEGQLYEAHGQSRYQGSSMLTFDIGPLVSQWRGTFDERAREELLDLIDGSVRVRLRVHRVARREAARRLAGANMGTATSETRISSQDSYIHMDIDLDVPVEVCSATGQET